MKKISKIFDELTESKNYKQILQQTINECNNRLHLIEIDELSKKAKILIKEHPKFIKLFSIHIKDVYCTECSFSTLDYHTQYSYTFQIGPLKISHYYDDDAESVYINGNTLKEQDYDQVKGPEQFNNDEFNEFIIDLNKKYKILEKDKLVVQKLIKDICCGYTEWKNRSDE